MHLFFSKTDHNSITRILFTLAILSFSVFSCIEPPEFKQTPDILLGHWESQETEINVREEIGFMQFEFTPGKGAIEIDFHEDNSITGSIGMSQFNNGVLQLTNIFMVKCDSLGKIFPEDPLPSKQVSLWLFDITEDSINVELRFTENGQKFPMAGFILYKVNED